MFAISWAYYEEVAADTKMRHLPVTAGWTYGLILFNKYIMHSTPRKSYTSTVKKHLSVHLIEHPDYVEKLRFHSKYWTENQPHIKLKTI